MNEDTMPGSTGKLTSRQREFLNSLNDLYAAHEQSVSYEDVAREMKVSKWTAYDILHDLYQRGFLRLEHVVTPGKGRSRILYTPEWGIASTSDGAPDDDATELAALKWLEQKVSAYSKLSVSDSMCMAARGIIRERNPFRVVLYVCVLVVLFTGAFELDVEQLIHLRRFVASALSAGTVLGLLSELMFSLMRDEKWLLENLGLSQEAIGRFAECEELFRRGLAQLNDGEKCLMVSVIRQAVTA